MYVIRKYNERFLANSFIFLAGDVITVNCDTGYSQNGLSGSPPTTSFDETLMCSPTHTATSTCLGESYWYIL